MIYSIGYGSRSFSSFVTLLRVNSISVVIDVRSYPYSRFDNFYSKAVLEELMPNLGFRYVYLGNFLGGENAKIAISDGFLIFRNNYLYGKKLGFVRLLRRVVRLSADNNVVLMCSEKDPLDCHRFYFLSYPILKLFKKDVTHILNFDKNVSTQALLKDLNKVYPLGDIDRLIYQRLRFIYTDRDICLAGKGEGSKNERENGEIVHYRFL